VLARVHDASVLSRWADFIFVPVNGAIYLGNPNCEPWDNRQQKDTNDRNNPDKIGALSRSKYDREDNAD
jgi:hypothetical protein